MKVINIGEEFSQDFEEPCIATRRCGNQETFYLPTVFAANFLANDKYVFPMQRISEDGVLTLVYYVEDMPSDYFYRKYLIYRLKKYYKTKDGVRQTAISFLMPIPTKMATNFGICKDNPKIHVNIRGGFLKDGSKVIMVQKYEPKRR